MSTPICIYHGNCQDGFTAAWAIWKKYPDWEFYPGKYQETPPDVTGREVFFVDFSYKRPVLLEMAAKALNITILDHHASAEKDLVDLPSNVYAKFDMNKSGGRLAWEWFHIGEDVPSLVKYVEDRDLWRFSYPNTRAVSAWVFSQNYDFDSWDDCATNIESCLTHVVDQGNAILRKQSKDIDELLQNKFLYPIGRHEVWVCNLPYTLCSEAGHILAQGQPFGATFYLDGTSAIFSLRSTEEGIDVSEIAKLYGGGGHKHAAGFKVPHNIVKWGDV